MPDVELRSIIFRILDAERAKGEDLQQWLSQDIICDLLDGPELAPYDAIDFDDIIFEWLRLDQNRITP